MSTDTLADKVIWEDPVVIPKGTHAYRDGKSLWERRLEPFVQNPGKMGRVPDLQVYFGEKGLARARQVVSRLTTSSTIESLSAKNKLGKPKARYKVPRPDGQWAFEVGFIGNSPTGAPTYAVYAQYNGVGSIFNGGHRQ